MAAEMKTNISDIRDEDDLMEDEEPGEEVESAPPLKVGEEREINSTGLKKKLIKRGVGWETPDFGYEVTVHYVGMLLDGTKFDSTRDRDQPFTFNLGHGQFLRGLEAGIISMKKGEIALFTLPPEMEYGNVCRDGVPPGSIIQFEVELLSWIVVVDVCKDGTIIKRILQNGESNKQPSDLDEVIVKYQVMLPDGIIVARTPEQGVEFYVKDGHLIPALSKVIKTMKAGERANLIIQPQHGFGDVGREAGSEFLSAPPNSVLTIDLDLVSFKPVIDVSGDSKIIKKILKEGEGTITAGEGAVVTVKYVAKLEDGTEFEKKGFDGEAPLEFITDEEQVIAGLDRAVSTMSKGEQAILMINPDCGFGDVETRRDLAVVPPSSNLIYEIQMLDFIKVLLCPFGPQLLKRIICRIMAVQSGSCNRLPWCIKKNNAMEPRTGFYSICQSPVYPIFSGAYPVTFGMVVLNTYISSFSLMDTLILLACLHTLPTHLFKTTFTY